ncbi:MAG: S24/S26 family peptidase [Acidobacteria bacterium]|nr:S24/S26 family peptidase [Acidobacteriota bacterium]
MSSMPISRTGHDVVGDDALRLNGAGAAGADLLPDILDRGVRVRVRVTGNSMRPAVRSGDRVTIEPVAAAAVRRGDILLIRDETGHLKLHRLVRIRRRDDRAYLTRGDALLTPDLPVAAASVLGRVGLIERGKAGGYTRTMDCLSPWRRVVHQAVVLRGWLRSVLWRAVICRLADWRRSFRG